MTIEPWADQELSTQLLQLCRAGEGQTLEFKSAFPAQARDLAKEIAALSSSDGGLLIIGVDDGGSVCGIPDVHDAAVRDMICQRVVGICQKVDPPVRPRLLWAIGNGLGVLCISVQKGAEPLYFVEQRPYVRHSNVSRPATPAEVAAAIARHATACEPVIDADVSTLAELLATMLTWCDMDSDIRSLSPWLEEWSAAANHGANTLRQLAASNWAATNDIGSRLEAAADKFEEVANSHLAGSSNSFEEVCTSVRSDAAELMQQLVWPVPIGNDNETAIRDATIYSGRRLTSLWNRAAKNVFDGRVEKAQEEAGALGKRMACWSYYKLTFLPKEGTSELRSLGLRLFQLSAATIYTDGGESLRRVVSQGQALSEDLAIFIQRYLIPAR